uniref:Fucosyltransferase n=1 Tax=Tetradesmus obliquus TaxID=3088 RepID=A0A383WMW8_TETOB|eukprot:jgi/Sobl393_1/14229/SZX78751.1
MRPGRARLQAAVAAAAANVTAEEVQQLKEQLASFRLRPSDLNRPFLPKRVYPIERGTCGTWMQPYAALHRDILQGRRPARYSIFRQDQNGLTDRLISSISVFLHALLTDRAFLFDWHGKHSLWDAYRSSYIDWRYDKHNPPEKHATSGQLLLLDINNLHGQKDHTKLHATYNKWFSDMQLEDVGANATVLIWTVNMGRAWTAVSHNRYIKQRLTTMGLNPVNTFGCLFDFLYRPTPATMSLVTPLLPQLLDPTTFKIGLQIRTGDEHIDGKSKQFQDAFEWFHCAKVVEKHWKPPAQKSIWFLLSDSRGIRQGAAEYLGPQVLTMKDAVVHHTNHLPAAASGKEATVLRFAAAETWLFSLMDVHVISQRSGFGRMGAMMSGRWDNVIQLPAGIWSMQGYEANLTYVAQPGEASMQNRTVVEAAKCANPSQPAGPAFCWPEDPPGPLPAMDDKSPMSLKIRHMCSKATPIEELRLLRTRCIRQAAGRTSQIIAAAALPAAAADSLAAAASFVSAAAASAAAAAAAASAASADVAAEPCCRVASSSS